ncbi:MAG: amino acid permease C-terminal domain-containing protein, partial [Phenylobacterium sp.]
LFPIGILGELVSVGTLLAFAVICAGVLWLRVRHPEMKRSFRTPLVWFTAPMGIAACLYLVANLGWPTLMRLFVWMAVGLVVYFGWAHWHARRFEAARAAPAE